MEFILSIDSAICLITGAIVGGLAGLVMKGLGLTGNVLIGLVGGLIGGLLFDRVDIIDVGDIADPAIAGLVGSIIVLAIVGAVQRVRSVNGEVV
jgi:uncharacterized membrane protein YeaQ/YmgE (transglycosylase-associated protein family)